MRPELFDKLDLRTVGRSLSKRGRLMRLGHEATAIAATTLLRQPRFARVLALDLRGLFLGHERLEENHLLTAAALACPNVCELDVDGAEPRATWSDLGRYVPAAFVRALRRLWPGRGLTVHGYGRSYDIEP